MTQNQNPQVQETPNQNEPQKTSQPVKRLMHSEVMEESNRRLGIVNPINQQEKQEEDNIIEIMFLKKR